MVNLLPRNIIRPPATVLIISLVLLLAGCTQSGARADSDVAAGNSQYTNADLNNSRCTNDKPADMESLENIYIGSLHSAHTLYGDGKLAYPEEFYSTFKPYWDWIATTAHDYAISPEEWQSLMGNARTHNSNKFVSFLGYEWTSLNWGHLSVVFRGDSPLSSGLASSSDPAFDSPQKLYAYLSSKDGLAGFAHPALPGLQIDFNRELDYRNDSVACLVGVFGYGDRSYWNANWDYADGRKIAAARADKADSGGWVKTALDRGYKLGFVSELDLHEKSIEPISYRYTGVLADNLSRDSIFKGLKSRHTYAVRSPSGLGKRIKLLASTDNHIMGDIFSRKSAETNVYLQGTTDLNQFNLVNLFLNGEVIETRHIFNKTLAEKFNFKLDYGANYIFFEVRAMAADGQESQAFTSPIYIMVDRGSG